MVIRFLRISALTITLATAPMPLVGQQSPGEAMGPRLDVVPRVGFVASHYEIGRTAALDDGNFVAFDRFGAGVAFGVDAMLLRPGSPWQLRAAVMHGSSGRLSGTWQCDGAGVLCPLDLRAPPSGRATITTVTVGAAYSPIDTGVPVRPFGSIGIGLKRHAFEWDVVNGTDAVLDGGSEGFTNPAVSIGAGLEWAWRTLSFVFEAENHASRFDSPDGGVVHDLLLTAGARIRMF